MAAIQGNVSATTCRKCGTAFSRQKGYFPVCYSELYKGSGYMPYCRECIDKIYQVYIDDGSSERQAMRQLCRKLDMYWKDEIFDAVQAVSASRNLTVAYIAKIASAKYSLKSYDDTLREEGSLKTWPVVISDNVFFINGNNELVSPVGVTYKVERSAPDSRFITIKYYGDNISSPTESAPMPTDNSSIKDTCEPISDEIRAFWGPGLQPDTYKDLDDRYKYWLHRIPDGVDTNDVGVQALLRQICGIEIEINQARAEGKSTDKLVNNLNTLLGSTMLKPAQRKEEADDTIDKTPLGVWTKLWEDKRPLPDIDPELKDKDHIIRYLTIWVLGHLCKMLKIKNTYSKMYEEEMARLRVERPQYADEDDEEMIYDIFGGDNDDKT